MVNIFKKVSSNPVCISLLLFIISFTLFYPWAFIDIDPHHDGILLKPAIDVASGKVLYRDTFTQYGALTTLLQAGVCSVFGYRLTVLRTLTLAFYCGSIVLLYLTGRRFASGAAVFLAIFVAFITAPFYASVFYIWSSVYALFFAMLSCYLTTFTEQFPRSRLLWFLLGVASILSFWCRQPCGLIFAAVFFYAILLRWKNGEQVAETLKRLFWLCFGAGSISGLLLTWIIFNGAWADFLNQSFGFAIKFLFFASSAPDSSSSSSFPPSLISHLIYSFTRFNFFAYVFYATVILLCILLCRCLICHSDKSNDWILLCLSMICLASEHQYYPVAESNHFYWGAFPAFVLYEMVALSLTRFSVRALPLRVFVASLGVFMALFPILRFSKQTVQCLLGNKPSSFTRLCNLDRIDSQGVLEGMYAQKNSAAAWEELIHFINDLPAPLREQPVLNLTPDAVFPLLFPNQSNWSRFYVNWGNGLDVEFTEKAQQRIKERDCIVLIYGDQEIDKTIIDENYRVLKQVRIQAPFCFYAQANKKSLNFPDGRDLLIMAPIKRY